jgi:hypothetical protein
MVHVRSPHDHLPGIVRRTHRIQHIVKLEAVIYYRKKYKAKSAEEKGT